MSITYSSTSRFALALATAAILCTTTANAVDRPVNDETIVTSTKTNRPLYKVGNTVSVLTADDLEKRQARSAIDILRELPGVTVGRNGAFGAVSTVRLRGANSRDTMVIIDGVVVSDPSSTQTAYDFGHLRTSDIKSIEVLRGSQSPLYGSEAIGGVINITTKSGTEELSNTASVEYGSYQSLQATYGLRGALAQKVNFAVNAEYYDTDGFSSRDTNTEDDGYENITLSGKVDLQATDHLAFGFNLRHIDTDAEYDNCSWPSTNDCDSKYKQTTGRADADLTLFDGSFSQNIGLAFSDTDRDYYANGAFDFASQGSRVTLAYQGTIRFNEANTLVFGYEHEEEEFSGTWNPSEDVNTDSLFGLYEIDVLNSLFLTAGLRLDDHQNFGSFETFKFSAAYQVPNTMTRLKASYDEGFRAPSLYELFSFYGDPMLQPEESKSYDLGVEQDLLGGDLSLGLTYFYLKTTNLIDFDFLLGGYIQIPGKTTSEGVESSVTYNGIENLTLSANYTYNKTNDVNGDPLVRRPKHEANLNANLVFLDGQANVNANIHFADGAVDNFNVDLDSYVLVDIAASLAVTENVEIYGRVENLLDENYQVVNGFNTPGLSAYAGARLTF